MDSIIPVLNNLDLVYCGMILSMMVGKATPSFYLLLFADDGTSPGLEESKLLQSASPGELSLNIFLMFCFIITQ